MKTILAFISSFLTAYLSLPVLRALALQFKILDFPGGRKIHKAATPLLGGMSIYLALAVGLIFGLKSIGVFLPILLGATPVFILGLVNDIRPLSARFRIACQLLISLAVVGMGLRISFLPVGPYKDIAETIITVIWLVGVTNAYNYLDGLDGLAAGSAVVNLSCFAVMLYITGQYSLGLLTIIMAGGCLGFLPYNFRARKVFLGEAGSTFLGFMLAAIAIDGTWAKNNIVGIAVPVLVLGVPIFDMIFTTITRIREGKVRTLFEWLQYSGKDHFHHYLVDLGFRPLGATAFIYFVTLSLGISAIIIVSGDIVMEGFLSISQAAIIFAIITALIIVGKKRRSGWQ